MNQSNIQKDLVLDKVVILNNGVIIKYSEGSDFSHLEHAYQKIRFGRIIDNSKGSGIAFNNLQIKTEDISSYGDLLHPEPDVRVFEQENINEV